MLKRRNKIKKRDERGIAALIVVVIIGAVALLMSLNASWFGIVDLDTGYISKKGEETATLADGCMDNALQRLRFDGSYSGETLNILSGSCIISVVSNGADRTITITAQDGNYSQGLVATATLTGDVVTVNSWQEN
jgi:hypothetical protein